MEEVLKNLFRSAISNPNPDHVLEINVKVDNPLAPKIKIMFAGKGYEKNEFGEIANTGMITQYHNNVPHITTVFSMPDEEHVEITWHAEGSYFEYQKDKIYDLVKFYSGGEKAGNN